MNKAIYISVLAMLFLIPSCKSPLALTLPVIEYFQVSPSSINKGETATLSWSVSNAKKVEINCGIGIVQATSSRTVAPTENTMYILTATNDGGETTADARITVKNPAHVIMTDLTYKAFPTIRRFSVWGRLTNNGGERANNLYWKVKFYYKDQYGGGLYSEAEWGGGETSWLNAGEWDDWRYDWDGTKGGDMCWYVNEDRREFVLTWK